MSSRRKQPSTKIIIGSEYIPEENNNYINLNSVNIKYKHNNNHNNVNHNNDIHKKLINNNHNKILKIKKINFNTLNQQTPYLEFKSSHGEPYVYIIDLISNTISDPILATPYYHCYNEKCVNKHHSITVKGSTIICNNCNNEIPICPHTFFNVNKYTFERRIKPENTKDLDINGIPLAWKLTKVENILGTTFNDCMRTYDTAPLMKPCDKSLYSKYYQLAKVNPNDLIGKTNYKLLIYRNYAIPLQDHIGAGLISVLNNGMYNWKLIRIEDDEQYITSIAKIPKVDGSYADFEHIEQFKEVLINEYLPLFGEF